MIRQIDAKRVKDLLNSEEIGYSTRVGGFSLKNNREILAYNGLFWLCDDWENDRETDMYKSIVAEKVA